MAPTTKVKCSNAQENFPIHSQAPMRTRSRAAPATAAVHPRVEAAPSEAGGGAEGDLVDMDVTCRDCHTDFVFTVQEQRFFLEHGYKIPRIRCKQCSEAKKLGNSGDATREPARRGRGRRGRRARPPPTSCRGRGHTPQQIRARCRCRRPVHSAHIHVLTGEAVAPLSRYPPLLGRARQKRRVIHDSTYPRFHV